MSCLNLAAAVVVRDSRGRFLLVKENYGQRRWGLPGGVVELGESPADAAIREAAEETGLVVELDHVIGLYYLRRENSGLRCVFAARIVGGEPALPSNAEISAIAWWEAEELPPRITDTAPIAVMDATAGRSGVFRELSEGPAR